MLLEIPLFHWEEVHRSMHLRLTATFSAGMSDFPQSDSHHPVLMNSVHLDCGKEQILHQLNDADLPSRFPGGVVYLDHWFP